MRKEKPEKEVKSKETGRSPVPILDLERQQTPRTWALTLFSIFSVFNMSLSPCTKVCRHPFTRDLAMIPMQHCNAVMLADATAKTAERTVNDRRGFAQSLRSRFGQRSVHVQSGSCIRCQQAVHLPMFVCPVHFCGS